MSAQEVLASTSNDLTGAISDQGTHRLLLSMLLLLLGERN